MKILNQKLHDKWRALGDAMWELEACGIPAEQFKPLYDAWQKIKFDGDGVWCELSPDETEAGIKRGNEEFDRETARLEALDRMRN